MQDFIAAVSVGIDKNSEPILDLCYEEDSNAIVDCNVAKTGLGKYVEIQGTGEQRPFTRSELDQMLELADVGIDELISLQKDALGGELVWKVGRVG